MVSVNVMQVPAAARNLKRNHLIRMGDLAQSNVAENVGTDTVGATDALIDRYLKVPKTLGESFKVTEIGSEPALDYQKSLLVTIGLAPHQALGGILEPDILLDVYGTPKGPAGSSSLPELLMRKVPLVAVAKNQGSSDRPLLLILSLPTGDSGSQAEAMCKKLVGASDLFIVTHGPL